MIGGHIAPLFLGFIAFAYMLRRASGVREGKGGGEPVRRIELDEDDDEDDLAKIRHVHFFGMQK